MSEMKLGNIPEGVWLEILKYLPVKTLGKCRCVCKSWHALVVSPPFMAAHLKTYTLDETNTMLLYRQVTLTPQKQEEYTLFHDSSEENQHLEPCHSFISPFMTEKGFLRVVGSANGLICLSNDLFGYTYLVILWNPLVRKYITLPMPRVCYHTHGAYISVLGFGYDARKGEHKVVRVVYVRNKEGLDTTPPLVELYSVQDGKWRFVSADCLVDHCICDRWWSQCFLNGAVHWVAWKRDAGTCTFDGNCLLLFDVEGEKFKRMKLPEPLVKLCNLDLRVTEYGGRLSVLRSVLSGGIIKGVMTHCDIWVKRGYNDGSSWSRMVSIDLDTSLGLSWVQCLRKNGELLAFTKGGKLVSYDPKAKLTTEVGNGGCWLTWFTGAYTESLTLLNKERAVQTYDEAGKSRKRFLYRISRSGDHFLEEVEAGSKVDDGLSTGGDETIHSADRFLILEQFLKFEGGGDPTKILSLATAYGF